MELRADRWQTPDWQAARQQIPQPIIATIRRREEGGEWEGSMRQWVQLYQAAIEAGCQWIDVDIQGIAAFDQDFLNTVFARRGVLSAHFTTAQSVDTTVRAMAAIPAAVYKCVLPDGFARCMRTVTALIDFWKSQNKKFIVHCSGENATSTRLWAAILGNAWTYIAAGTERTAAGQPTMEELRWYRLDQKTPETRLLGLFGYPLHQSRGWQLHNALLALFGYADRWLYLNFPDPDFSAAFAAWQSWLDGASITIPHKQTAVAMCEERSPEVQMTGVCNTILRREDHWAAFNTDFLALRELLLPFQSQLRRALVVGTGATARTAIGVLQQMGVSQIWVMGRSAAKRKALATHFHCSSLPLGAPLPAPVDILIHATPVGMVPNTEQMLPLTPYLQPQIVLVEVVHNPAETLLVQTARQQGVAAIITGIELFLHQARYQFQLFTNVCPSIQQMWQIWKQLQ